LNNNGFIGQPCRCVYTWFHKTNALTLQVYSKASCNIFQSAAEVVEDVLSQTAAANVDAPPASRPNVHYLARAANRRRMNMRPAEPKTLDFDLASDFLPTEFLQADIRVGKERHLLFATSAQLELLAKARTWYMDGTFKVVRRPFTQLFSIHAFIKKDDNWKQVPLAFVLMSRRKAKDYKKVRPILHKYFVVVNYTY